MSAFQKKKDLPPFFIKNFVVMQIQVICKTQYVSFANTQPFIITLLNSQFDCQKWK